MKVKPSVETLLGVLTTAQVGFLELGNLQNPDSSLKQWGAILQKPKCWGSIERSIRLRVDSGVLPNKKTGCLEKHLLLNYVKNRWLHGLRIEDYWCLFSDPN